MECDLKKRSAELGSAINKRVLEIQNGINILNQWLSENREKYPT